MELFTKCGLSYISSALGVPLYMDHITATQQRLAYAKVYVEVDASFIIPCSIPVTLRNGSIISVAVHVPWMPQKCSCCCIFGHADSSCPRKSVAKVAKTWIPVKQTAINDTCSSTVVEDALPHTPNSFENLSRSVVVDGDMTKHKVTSSVAVDMTKHKANSVAVNALDVDTENSIPDDVPFGIGTKSNTDVDPMSLGPAVPVKAKNAKKGVARNVKAGKLDESSSSCSISYPQGKSGSENKYLALMAINEEEELAASIQDLVNIEEGHALKSRKPKAASTSVATIMQALKPEKDKAKHKQVQAVIPALGCNLLNLST
ncbi:hypothetical protein REPUB_Repub18cG0049800 [Reevesia pubescens]